MKEEMMAADNWKEYLGIGEETDETVPVDDVEGEWEDVRKF